MAKCCRYCYAENKHPVSGLYGIFYISHGSREWSICPHCMGSGKEPKHGKKDDFHPGTGYISNFLSDFR